MINSNMPDKPFKTFHELVEYLQREHNLYVIDPAWAENALKLVPYYDLNLYKMKVFLLRKIIYKNPAAIRTYDDGNRNDIGYPSGSCNNPTTG